MPQLTYYEVDVQFVDPVVNTLAELNYGLGIGAILGGAFSCVGAVASLGYAMMK